MMIARSVALRPMFTQFCLLAAASPGLGEWKMCWPVQSLSENGAGSVPGARTECDVGNCLFGEGRALTLHGRAGDCIKKKQTECVTQLPIGWRNHCGGQLRGWRVE